MVGALPSSFTRQIDEVKEDIDKVEIERERAHDRHLVLPLAGIGELVVEQFQSLRIRRCQTCEHQDADDGYRELQARTFQEEVGQRG